MSASDRSVRIIVQNNLCISCGICGGVCTAGSISYEKTNGMYYPVIDESCVSCGRCMRCCPKSALVTFEELDLIMEEEEKNTYLSAKTRCDDVLKNATSGGVITTLVDKLLKDGSYDCAFLVRGYSCKEPLQSVYVCTGDNLSDTQGSRYLPVMHTEAVNYMLSNRSDRIIFVGTPCFFHGLTKVISEFDLERDNYLLLGLFCAQVMNYNSTDYFENKLGAEHSLCEIHYRDKSCGGWPGNVSITNEKGEKIVLNKRERMAIKEYYMPESCLYCVDKLNKNADIAVGDDYTKALDTVNGASSVIIRSERGQSCFDNEMFVTKVSSSKEINRTQKVGDLVKHRYFYHRMCIEKLFKSTKDIPDISNKKKLDREYKRQLLKIELGKNNNIKKISGFVNRRLRKEKSCLWIILRKVVRRAGFLK